MQKQVHATRTAPLCKDCKHYVMGRRPDMALCGHPGTPISLTDGSPVMSTNCMRGDDGAVFRLMNVTPCGSTGNLFEPSGDSADQITPGVVGKEPLVDGSGSGEVAAEQGWVGLSESVPELLVDSRDGEVYPAIDGVVRKDFKRFHEPLPQGVEASDGNATSTGQEATPCE